jgi:hypothetical protein
LSDLDHVTPPGLGGELLPVKDRSKRSRPIAAPPAPADSPVSDTGIEALPA